MALAFLVPAESMLSNPAGRLRDRRELGEIRDKSQISVIRNR
jgi:hypothetical protein